MRILAKITPLIAVMCLTAMPVYAQITLNLDVLTEDFIPKDATTSAPAPAAPPVVAPVAPPVAAPAPKVKEKPVRLKRVEQKKVAPKKVETKKPTKKSKTTAKKASKSALKASAKSKTSSKNNTKSKKYQVKESKIQDEHDRLKPRAKPVPTVKVVPIKERVRIKIAETRDDDNKPQISKHFLEQQQALKEAREEDRSKEKIVLPPPEKKSVPAPETFFAKGKKKTSTVRDEAERIAQKEETKEPKTKILPFASVIRTAENMTQKERSEALVQKLPKESETVIATQKRKLLAAVLLFKDTSADLTEEMGKALDTLIAYMRKHPEKRMTVFAYSAPTKAPDYGRERQVSLRRALSVRSYMSRAGINSLRVDIRALGQRGAGSEIPNRADVLIYER
ncbi:lysophospholipase [Acetobacter sp. CAG:977]|nr:lysophospholipase [Acetobacter sp. CAG:977]